MLLITEEQFLEELKSEPSLSQKMIPVIPDKVVMENHTYDNFRKDSVPNLPVEVKTIVASIAQEDKQENVAKAFSVSKQTVGNLENGKHSNPLVKERVSNTIDRIKEKTLGKIEESLDFLAISKELKEKPMQLVAVAEGLSRIHKNVSVGNGEGDGKTQFIFYIPEGQKKIEDFGEIIDAQV